MLEFINKVNYMDCLPAMRLIADKYFDLAVVDPPYGINVTNNKNGSSIKNNKKYLSTTEKIKGRLNQGSGKLKNRILNNSEINWDNERPCKEYFIELFRISKNKNYKNGNFQRSRN